MQYGENTTWIPAELRSAAADGVGMAAASVYDYRQAKFQEDINHELYTGQSTLSNNWANAVTTIQNDMSTLQSNVNSTMRTTLSEVTTLTGNVETHMDAIDLAVAAMRQDNADTKAAIQSLTPDQSGALALATTVQNNTEDIETLQGKVGALSLRVLTESEYENLETYSANTLYFVEEDAA